MILALLASVALTCKPIATDGDSIRCGDERIRLLAIDTPEMGLCQPAGRVCVQGDPIRSRESLAAALESGGGEIERVGIDRYGRTLATVTAGDTNLSCHQIHTCNAVYATKWDNGGRMRLVCSPKSSNLKG